MAAPEIVREITPRAAEIAAQFPTRADRLRTFDARGLSMSGQEVWLMLPESDQHPLLHGLRELMLRYTHAGASRS